MFWGAGGFSAFLASYFHADESVLPIGEDADPAHSAFGSDVFVLRHLDYLLLNKKYAPAASKRSVGIDEVKGVMLACCGTS